jgi:NTE family protein
MTKIIGLALSGGGARGLAHIGVLKVLDSEGIKVGFIAGTSMGGIIGAAYACGYAPSEIEEIALRFSRRGELIKFIDLHPNRRGLLEGNKVRNFLRDTLGSDLEFSQLKIPLLLVAVDLNSGKEVVFSEGKVLPAIFATSAIPGIFSPIEYQSKVLVDGGVLNNLPVENLKTMGAEINVAVDVQYDPRWGLDQQTVKKSRFPVPSYFLDMYKSITIMMTNMTDHHIRLAQPNLVIKPQIPMNITSVTGFTKAIELIKIGEESTKIVVDRLIKMINE